MLPGRQKTAVVLLQPQIKNKKVSRPRRGLRVPIRFRMYCSGKAVCFQYRPRVGKRSARVDAARQARNSARNSARSYRASRE